MVVQRNYRKYQARLKFKQMKLGQIEEPVQEDTARIKLHKLEHDKVKRFVEAQYIDNYYKPVTEERKRELLDEVVKRRKCVAESDLQQYNVEKIKAAFDKKYSEFYDNYALNESVRVHSLDMLKQTNIIKDFLIDFEE